MKNEKESCPELWVADTMMNLEKRLSEHNSIAVGVSGGSDSTIIVHMICTEFKQYLPNVHFVFEDTGFEYQATRRFLDELEQKYGISIDRVRGEPIPLVVKREGFPILSKEFSFHVSNALRGVPSSVARVNRTKEDSPYGLSEKQKALADYLIENRIQVSSKCCDLSKKRPHKKYLKSIGADLTITGERRAEGGQRATIHHGCFESGKGKKIDKYMPLWWWDDDTKQWYKEQEGIRYSDCYEVWGMKRTGCVGCPFNSRVGEDLKMIQKYEPNMYKACMNIFGESYRLMDKFNVHRKKIFDSLDDDIEQTSFLD